MRVTAEEGNGDDSVKADICTEENVVSSSSVFNHIMQVCNGDMAEGLGSLNQPAMSGKLHLLLACAEAYVGGLS